PTLMHDITYRECVAWQNNHYNQPTNTSFYMGAETTTVPAPEIKTTSGKTSPDAGKNLAVKKTAEKYITVYYEDGKVSAIDNSNFMPDINTINAYGAKLYVYKDGGLTKLN
ncbi:MAG: hypothetical protein IJG06_09260, partial [Clostridia bacterium]|nr:hypothetical protein [Clostridia bacterium]